MTERRVDPVAAARARLRASDADRERAIEALKAAFTRGRLTRDELDARLDRAMLARTYAEVAAAIADMPARSALASPALAGPEPARRGPGGTGGAGHPTGWPPPLAGQARRRPANHWAFTSALGLATVALPVMMVAALSDRSQDLFCASIVLLMTYVMAMMVAAANVVAARFDDSGRRAR